MNYYCITAPFITVVGQVHLTDAQADARKAMLAPIADKLNHFSTRQAIGFKKGEILGCSASLQGADRLDLSEDQFGKRIIEERQALANQKAAILKARADREAKMKQVAAQRLKERDARAAAMAKARSK